MPLTYNLITDFKPFFIIELLTKASSSQNVWCKSFRKIHSFGFGIAFSISFLGNKSCFYIVLVDESDLQRDKAANILHD